jgi:hypothetical protein
MEVMEAHIMEHGQDGYKMSLEKKDKEYLIQTKIKVLNGKKELLFQNNPIDDDTEKTINDKIQALTNMLEML